MPLPPVPATSAPERGAADGASAWPALRKGFAALGLVGALAVGLPLVQVMRYQQAEITELSTQRAALDPIGRALALQRGLLGHRDMAARVLGGAQALEAERRLLQSEVDHRSDRLVQTLDAGLWLTARREADSLREDWSALRGRVQQRAVDAAASDEAHRLLVEQALQVIDIVGDGLPAAVAAAGAATVPRQAPGWPQHARLALKLAQSDGAAAEAELHVLEAATLRAASALDHRIDEARTDRARLIAACALLLLGAGICARRLWRAVRAASAAAGTRPDADVDDVDSDVAWTAAHETAHRHDASDLIERLRRSDEQRADAQTRDRAEPERTPPPG